MEDTEMNVQDISISEIKTAKRIRKDVGNIAGLAEDIRSHGLINPITVMEQENGGFLLITGFRRMQAYRLLGLSRISASVLSPIDASECLMLEISENEKRQDFTVTERLEYAEKIKAVEKEKAHIRMSAHARDGYKERTTYQGWDGCPYPENRDNCDNSNALGRTRDFVAKAAGFSSGKSFERAEYVAKHKPELLQKIDEGKLTVNGAYEKIRKEKSDKKSEIVKTEKKISDKTQQLQPDEKSQCDGTVLTQEIIPTIKFESTIESDPTTEPLPMNILPSVSNSTSPDDSYQTTGIPANSNAPCYLGMQGAENWEPLRPIQLFKIKTPKNGGHESLLSNPLYAAVYEKYTEAMQSCNLVLGCWDHLKDGYETRIRGDQTNINTLIRARDKAEDLAEELSSKVKTLTTEKGELETALNKAIAEKQECIKEANDLETRWADAESKRRRAEGESKALRIEVEALKRELYGK